MGLFSLIKEDITIRSGNSFFKQLLAIYFNNSLRLIINYRLGHYFATHRNPVYSFFILCLKRKQLKKYGCDISYQAKIGRRIKFPHPIGIVIGTDVVIEDDVMIWQHVTLGSSGKGDNMTYPTIMSNARIYSNAQVLGRVIIGNKAQVGALSLVLQDIPSGKIAVGIPAKVIEKTVN